VVFFTSLPLDKPTDGELANALFTGAAVPAGRSDML
jgi:hypothetical protein